MKSKRATLSNVIFPQIFVKSPLRLMKQREYNNRVYDAVGHPREIKHQLIY